MNSSRCSHLSPALAPAVPSPTVQRIDFVSPQVKAYIPLLLIRVIGRILRSVDEAAGELEGCCCLVEVIEPEMGSGLAHNSGELNRKQAERTCPSLWFLEYPETEPRIPCVQLRDRDPLEKERESFREGGLTELSLQHEHRRIRLQPSPMQRRVHLVCEVTVTRLDAASIHLEPGREGSRQDHLVGEHRRVPHHSPELP